MKKAPKESFGLSGRDMTGWSRWMIRRGVVTPAFQMLCLYLIRGRRNKKCLKKASDTLKHETEITIGDWDTDRVSVAQEWQFGKFELFIDRLRRIDTQVFHSAMENLGVLIKLSTLIGKKICKNAMSRLLLADNGIYST